MRQYRSWFIGAFTISILIILGRCFWAFHDFFSFSYFLKYAVYWEHLLKNHYGMSVIIYSALYSIIAAAGLPIGLIISMIGGFLFGCKEAFVYTVISTTFGGILSFAMIRLWAQPYVERKYGYFLNKFQHYFEKSALYYIFALHFLPVVPFGAITALSALSPMKLYTFAWATFFAVMPGSWFYACAGSHIKTMAYTGAFETSRAFYIFYIVGAALLVYALGVSFKQRYKK